MVARMAFSASLRGEVALTLLPILLSVERALSDANQLFFIILSFLSSFRWTILQIALSLQHVLHWSSLSYIANYTLHFCRCPLHLPCTLLCLLSTRRLLGKTFHIACRSVMARKMLRTCFSNVSARSQMGCLYTHISHSIHYLSPTFSWFNQPKAVS